MLQILTTYYKIYAASLATRQSESLSVEERRLVSNDAGRMLFARDKVLLKVLLALLRNEDVGITELSSSDKASGSGASREKPSNSSSDMPWADDVRSERMSQPEDPSLTVLSRFELRGLGDAPPISLFEKRVSCLIRDFA
jgi:hypothetical protein